MEKKSPQKKAYLSPKIETMSIEMESCFYASLANSYAKDKTLIKNFLSDNMEFAEHKKDTPSISS